MIPKKIHYCWFSNDPYPDEVKRCLASWHQYMPDYEYILWDSERIKNVDSVWLRECLEERKWAFAADFIRVYALYQEGGIYLDSDVVVFRSFDDLLDHRFFIGREECQYATFDDGVQQFLSGHCFGSEAGHSFLGKLLEYYSGRHFRRTPASTLPEDLRYDTLMLPYIQSRIAESFGYCPSLNADYLQKLQEDMVVFPSSYFGFWRERTPQTSTYAIHLGQGSWRDEEYWRKHPPMQQYHYTFRYKIRWRIVVAMKWIARKLGYVMLKIDKNGYE